MKKMTWILKILHYEYGLVYGDMGIITLDSLGYSEKRIQIKLFVPRSLHDYLQIQPDNPPHYQIRDHNILLKLTLGSGYCDVEQNNQRDLDSLEINNGSAVCKENNICYKFDSEEIVGMNGTILSNDYTKFNIAESFILRVSFGGLLMACQISNDAEHCDAKTYLQPFLQESLALSNHVHLLIQKSRN